MAKSKAFTIRERTLMADWPKYCSAPSGYVAWHEWAEAQGLHGLSQTQCARCKRHFFPQEYEGHTCISPKKRPSAGRET